MRYGIFSDIHSNLEALDAVIRAYGEEKIDKYLCAGDIVGYGAEPNECTQKVRGFTETVIAGNHDQASVGSFPADYFNPFAREAVLWTGGVLDGEQRIFLEGLALTYKNSGLTLVHGTLDEPGDFGYMTDIHTARKTFELLETQVCFIGHTHVPGIFCESKNGIEYKEDGNTDIKEGNRYIVNVGSVGQPRDGDPRAAYCVYDTGTGTVSIKRVDYDVNSARDKIIASGLPRFLGERLLVGR